MKFRSKEFAVFILVNGLAVAAAYGIFEYKVRLELKEHYSGNATPMMVRNQTLTRAFGKDILTGEAQIHPDGLIMPNEVFDTIFILRNKVVFESHARSNNLGFLSEKTYSIEPDPENKEFRIALLGDSMTGQTTADTHWPDVLEDILNSQAELKEKSGNINFRIYNGALPGAGFKAFWRIYEESIKQFNPDLIIVNYIESDFPRTGKPGHMAHMSDEEAMVSNALVYVRKFLELDIPVFFTVMPLYADLYPELLEFLKTHTLKKMEPKSKVFMMHERMPWKGKSRKVYQWYNLPHDGHMSEKGGVVYAWAMAGLIAEQVAGVAIEERKEPLEFSKLNAMNWKHNLIQNGDFSQFPREDSILITHDSLPIQGGWAFTIDGANGTGRGSLKQGKADQDQPHLSLLSNTYFQYQEVAKPTNGNSSLSTYIRGWQSKAGLQANLVFRARSENNSPLHVHLQASFGSHKSGAQSAVLFSEPIYLTDMWQEITVPVDLSLMKGKQSETEDQDYIFVSFQKWDRTKPLNFALGDVLFLVEKDSGSSFKETVGKRKIPVEAFTKLRKDINERFVASRSFSFKPYGFFKLLGRDIRYTEIPPNKKIHYGLEKLILEVDPPEPVYLYLYCTSLPLTLDNPDCHHFYQVFVQNP